MLPMQIKLWKFRQPISGPELIVMKFYWLTEGVVVVCCFNSHNDDPQVVQWNIFIVAKPGNKVSPENDILKVNPSYMTPSLSPSLTEMSRTILFSYSILHLSIWVIICDLRCSFWLKAFPQISQLKGLSPVCILSCLCKCDLKSKDFPQMLHVNSLKLDPA